MLTRRSGYLRPRDESTSAAAEHLQREGYVVLRDAFSAAEVTELGADIDRVFDEYSPDVRRDDQAPELWEEFRYEMLNRSAIVQRLVASQTILDVVQPLLGEDCHVIANTAWRNPPSGDKTHGGGNWHMDSGPHIPRPAGIEWDARIPYPVFAVAVHVLLRPMPIESGPTGVLARSHTSGQVPPADRRDDVTLTWSDQPVIPLVADAGAVVMFVSDIWHRRLPTQVGDPGRFFLQIHYGRRDIAQRLRPTAVANHLSAEAIERAGDNRAARSVIGLHAPFFYDG